MAKPVAINKTAVTIGRGPGNDVVLPYDTEVSRRHAEVRREGAGLMVFDLNSSNGTQVNGEKVASRPLYEGDQIRVGNTTLWLQGGQLWVPDEAVAGAPAGAGRAHSTPLLLLLGGLGIAAAVLLLVFLRRQGSPVQGVVAIIGGGSTSGSGTMVDRRGLVLTTNSIVAGAEKPLVGLADRPEVAPSNWYISRVVQVDKDLNLAVLLITSLSTGAPLVGQPEFPAVAIGNSDTLEEGESLKAVGYRAMTPLLPVSFTENVRVQDEVIAEFRIYSTGQREWIEMDRPYEDVGFTGGAMLTRDNLLVGVIQPGGDVAALVGAVPGTAMPAAALLSTTPLALPINLTQGLIDAARRSLGW
jgi:S1-C subfamily serine protease